MERVIKHPLVLRSARELQEDRLERDQKFQLGDSEIILLVENAKSILKHVERMIISLGYK